jgi:hypothetical protein
MAVRQFPPAADPQLSADCQRPRDREPGLRLRLRADIGWVRIEVFDTDPELPRPCTPGGLDESGFGFVLIEALAARWGVHQAPGGKTVWAEIAGGSASAGRRAARRCSAASAALKDLEQAG